MMRTLLTLIAQATPAQYPDNTAPEPGGWSVGPDGQIKIPKVDATHSSIQVALGAVFGIIGAVAVLYIILGGISYIYSSGEPQKTKQAKETIIYAIIGLVIAITAETIIWTVLSQL